MFARAPCDLHPAKILLEEKVAHFYRPVISARYNASGAGVASVTEVQAPAML
jgi:hypothetical protein